MIFKKRPKPKGYIVSLKKVNNEGVLVKTEVFILRPESFLLFKDRWSSPTLELFNKGQTFTFNLYDGTILGILLHGIESYQALPFFTDKELKEFLDSEKQHIKIYGGVY